MRTQTRRLLCCGLMVGLSACTVRHGDFTVISNKLVRTSDFELSTADRRRGIVGEDKAHIIILFPTKAQVTLEEAIDDALRQGEGDVLTDAVIEFTSWYIPYVYGQTSWKVTGDVVKTRRN